MYDCMKFWKRLSFGDNTAHVPCVCLLVAKCVAKRLRALVVSEVQDVLCVGSKYGHMVCVCVCVCVSYVCTCRGRGDDGTHKYQLPDGFHFGGGSHYGFHGNHKHPCSQVSAMVTLWGVKWYRGVKHWYRGVKHWYRGLFW